MVSGAEKPRRSYKEQMADRIPRFFSGQFKSLISNPTSSVSINHRTSKAFFEGSLFASRFSSGGIFFPKVP